jgi:hypothetical protein
VGTSSASLSNSKVEIAGDSNANFLSILNSSASDVDGNRYSKIMLRGTQSGGETSTLCSVQSAHDGSSDDEKGRLTFHTNDGSDGDAPTERMRIDSTGAIILPDGSPGIQFGTFSAPATSTSLDDYEEGTWTPRFQGTTGTSGDTYTSQLGYYIKVGNKITVAFTLSLSTQGSRSGSLVIGGLPYNASNEPNSGAGNISYFTDVSFAMSYIACNLSTGNSWFFVNYAGPSTTAMVNDPSILTTNTRMDGIFTYFTI